MMPQRLRCLQGQRKLPQILQLYLLLIQATMEFQLALQYKALLPKRSRDSQKKNAKSKLPQLRLTPISSAGIVSSSLFLQEVQDAKSTSSQGQREAFQRMWSWSTKTLLNRWLKERLLKGLGTLRLKMGKCLTRGRGSQWWQSGMRYICMEDKEGRCLRN